MSAAAAIASSFLTSAAMVGPPTAAIVVAQTADNLPDVAKYGLTGVGLLTFIVTFLKQGGLATLSKLFGAGDKDASKPAAEVPRPDHPLPRPLSHGAHLVTHAELEARLARIELKIDDNAKQSSEDIKDLTDSMTTVIRDMTKALGQVEGKLEALRPSSKR